MFIEHDFFTYIIEGYLHTKVFSTIPQLWPKGKPFFTEEDKRSILSENHKLEKSVFLWVLWARILSRNLES